MERNTVNQLEIDVESMGKGGERNGQAKVEDRNSKPLRRPEMIGKS